MSGFDQRDLTRKAPSTNQDAISLDGRSLADVFNEPSLSSEERAIYHGKNGAQLASDPSFCDTVSHALTQYGSAAESLSLIKIAARGSDGLHAIHAMINNPESIDRLLHESGFYDRTRTGSSPSERHELVATKLTHLLYHLESTSRALTSEDSKVAADILLEVSQSSGFERAKRHALRVLPAVMNRQGRAYEDPVAQERTRGGGLMG